MASLALSGQTTPVAKCSSFSVPFFHNTQNAKVQSLGKINNKNANVNQRKQKKRKKKCWCNHFYISRRGNNCAWCDALDSRTLFSRDFSPFSFSRFEMITERGSYALLLGTLSTTLHVIVVGHGLGVCCWVWIYMRPFLLPGKMFI